MTNTMEQLFTTPQIPAEVKEYIERLEKALHDIAMHWSANLSAKSSPLEHDLNNKANQVLTSKPEILKCDINKLSSRACELGTKSCVVYHSNSQSLKD